MDNYSMHNSVRTRDGGGISIYIHKSLHANTKFEHTDENNHFIITHIHKYNLNIIALYNTRYRTFLPQLESILENNSNCVIFGDINIDLMNNNNIVNNYLDIIDSNGYAILNKINSNYCTRLALNSKSIIDHVLTDKYNYKYTMSLNSQCYTDHDSAILQIEHQSIKHCQNTICTLNKIDFRSFYNVMNNEIINEISYTELHDKIQTHLNSFTQPILTKKNYKNKLQFLSRNLKAKLKKRDAIYALLKHDQNNLMLKSLFQNLKKETKTEILKEKQEFYNNKILECGLNIKKL